MRRSCALRMARCFKNCATESYRFVGRHLGGVSALLLYVQALALSRARSGPSVTAVALRVNVVSCVWIVIGRASVTPPSRRHGTLLGRTIALRTVGLPCQRFDAVDCMNRNRPAGAGVTPSAVVDAQQAVQPHVRQLLLRVFAFNVLQAVGVDLIERLVRVRK